MSKKTDKLKEIKKEINDLERKKQHLKQTINNKRKNEDRKKRANRLIQTGALAEKYFEIHNLSMEEREQLFKMFATFIKSNKPKHLKK